MSIYGKEETISSNTSGMYGQGSELGSGLDDISQMVDLARDWAISEELVDDPIASDYSSKKWANAAGQIVSEFDSTVDEEIGKVTAEGDKQVERVTNVGNAIIIDAAESASEAEASAEAAAGSADSAKEDADRAEDSLENAEDIGSAIRNRGEFMPSQGQYPEPNLQYLAQVWYAGDAGLVGNISWTIGDMLSYVPHLTDPEGTLGQYYRIAGELAAGGDPQPVLILDHLVMVKDKAVTFVTNDTPGAETIVTALHVDTEGDLVLGALDYGTGENPIGTIGLAAPALKHVIATDADGIITEASNIITDEAGDVVRIPNNQTISGVKQFSGGITLPASVTLSSVADEQAGIMFGTTVGQTIIGGTGATPVQIRCEGVNGFDGRAVDFLADGNVAVDVGAPTAVNQLTRKDYVDNTTVGKAPIDIADFNDAIESGFYKAAAGRPNAPEATGGYAVMVTRADNTNQALQIASPVSVSPTNAVWFRRRYQSTWQAWTRFANYAETVRLDGAQEIVGLKTFAQGAHVGGQLEAIGGASALSLGTGGAVNIYSAADDVNHHFQAAPGGQFNLPDVAPLVNSAVRKDYVDPISVPATHVVEGDTLTITF